LILGGREIEREKDGVLDHEVENLIVEKLIDH
jgi:hypothetical protein